MEKIAYTAEALSTGDGRNGHVRTTDGLIDLELRRPKGMGGSGDGSNPEALFAAGYAACFHSALRHVARDRHVELHDDTVGARVHIGPNGEGGYELAAELEVVLPGIDHATAEALTEGAHELCPYSNATRGNIEVKLTVGED